MTATQAIVTTAPVDTGHTPGDNWHLQDVLLPSQPGEKEVLVEMAASGICHTDLTVTCAPLGRRPYPMIAGHEGAGYIKAIGPGVRKDLAVGDPVLLSFYSCTDCTYCNAKLPACCESSPRNLGGTTDVFTSADGQEPIAGKFFGHSSFAKLSIVNEVCILPAMGLIQKEEDLKLFAPLGCGLQTGAGSVLNVAKATKEDSVMVLGLGGVGLSAVMAAKIAGCRQIIAVDRVPSRIEMAKSLGATDGLDTTGIEDITKAMKDITGGLGPAVIIETTAVIKLVQAAFHALAKHGSLVFVGGSADPNYGFHLPLREVTLKGIKLLGCVMGDSVPHEAIPQLIRYYREGSFPLDKLVKYYKPENFRSAVHDMHSGETIKPALVW